MCIYIVYAHSPFLFSTLEMYMKIDELRFLDLIEFRVNNYFMAWQSILLYLRRFCEKHYWKSCIRDKILRAALKLISFELT